MYDRWLRASGAARRTTARASCSQTDNEGRRGDGFKGRVFPQPCDAAAIGQPKPAGIRESSSSDVLDRNQIEYIFLSHLPNHFPSGSIHSEHCPQLPVPSP